MRRGFCVWFESSAELWRGKGLSPYEPTWVSELTLTFALTEAEARRVIRLWRAAGLAFGYSH